MNNQEVVSVSYTEKVKDRSIDTRDELSSLSKRVWRKLDWHLLPFVTFLYLLSFLDRANIGNAKIAGMSKDLLLAEGLNGLKYNIAAALFYIPYALGEIPSNIVLKLVRPSIWIPSTMAAWGTVIALMCRVESFQGLVVARIFLGLTECGLFPGVTYYISLWYPRRMQASRIAIFFAGASVAGAFGGVLAYGIEHLDGKGGLHGWQWIFLIEGLATVMIAVTSYFFMHDYPDTARFLTQEERNFVVATLRDESHNQATHFELRFVWQAFADWKTWLHTLMFMGVLIPIYALALFLPSIIAGLGYSAANAQLLTIPPFVCGCICTVFVGISSDRLQLRGPFLAVCSAVSMIGYIVAYTTNKPASGYLAAIIAAIGVYPTIAVIVAWAGGNAGGDMKRGVVLAMVIDLGNLGGICSSFVYNDPPRYHHGHGTMIGWLGTSLEDYCKREGITVDMQDQFRDMGDKSPLFRYVV
ncbi:MFS general substrate transporter [Vararia minispora EC-137]|uniref:MFS general substrate transporter n=1 Tax=Vararia minispora EC-137 TaxID=1314806 RepID=A0ACB8QML7_9AGAM|nr:MFS general substrate transporter [Vararia minispora EC-137]